MMNQIRTVLLLAVFGCGSATGGDATDPHTNGGEGGSDNVGVAGTDSGAGAGGDAGASNQGGAGGSSQGGAGGSTAGSAGQGGAAGAPQGGAAGQGGGNQGGSSGAAGEAGSAGQGGAAGEGGSAGQGGSDQGGSGGSEAGSGGSAGEAGSSGNPDPAPPACTFYWENQGPGTRCNGLLWESCVLDGDGAPQYTSAQCGTAEVGFNCNPEDACFGECSNGDVRCSGDTAETCVAGGWETTETCAYQCVNGACAGACTPEEAVCDGASVVTCGQDFRFGDAVACEGAPNANPSCSGAGECGTACVPGFDDCSAAPGCETDLSSPDSCGACGNVCPGAPNATRTCNGGVCGLQPNACAEGTGNCTGDFVCETDTDSDENNCGGCGVKCYGTCSEGECSVEVVGSTDVLDYSVVDLFVGTTHVYWWTSSSEGGAIWRAPKDGSASAQPLTTFPIPSDYPRDNALLVEGGHLYWATVSGVFRMPEAGGTVTTISTSGASGLAIADGKLYWNNVNVNAPTGTCLAQYSVNNAAFIGCNNARVVTFYTYNIDTQSLTTWTTNQFEYGHVLAVIGSEVFVARFRAMGAHNGVGQNYYDMGIFTLNTATGAPMRGIVSIARDSNNNAVSLGDLFNQAVFTGSTVVFATNLGVFQTSIANPGDASIITQSFSANSRPQCMAVDASAVYYPTGTNVDKITRSTSAVSPVIANPDYGSRVALDGGDLYWTMQAEGRQLVLRTAK